MMTTTSPKPSVATLRRPAPWRQSWLTLGISTAARVVLGVLVLLLLLSVLPSVVGWQTSVVMSGSMEPTLMPGDVTLVRPVDTARLHPGQVVLVDDPDQPGELRMHRIAGLEDGQLWLRGDANPRPDTTLVQPSAVHGVGAMRLPDLGLPALWAAEGRLWPLAGTGAALAALLALVLLHRCPEEPAGPVGGDAGRQRRFVLRRRPGRPSKTLVRRGVVFGVAVVALVAPAAASGAAARFSAVTANPTSRFDAASNWACASTATAAGALTYLSLQDSAGPTALNTGSDGSAGNGTYSSGGLTYGVPGPECGSSGNTAVTLDGATGSVWTTQAVVNPQTFSVQIWFATTTTSGGKLIGFGNGVSGATSSHFDRHIYLTDTGQLTFGVYNGAQFAVSSQASYNDGRWHLATATFSPGTGMKLYADGALVGASTATTAAENYTGYWRIGYDNLGPGWPGNPTSAFYAGSVAHASVYGTVLSADVVANQYGAGPVTCAAAAGPNGTAAPQYYPLQEPGGTTAANIGTAGMAANATYSGGGVTYGVRGPQCGPGASAAVRLDGLSGQIWTSQAVVNPQTFTEQIWFATTTTSGGKLIGFGTGANGATSNRYDRHIYLTNAGRLYFGLYNGGFDMATSPASYNDGRWHLAVATFSAGTGMRLYVDGALVVSNATATVAETTTGYWRIGFDDLGGWPDAPSSLWFAGSIAQVGIYDRVLSAAEVSALYTAGS